MSWRCSELESPEDRARAAEDARVWGYPRAVEPVEIERGFWFRMGRGVVWWLQEPTLVEDDGTIPALFGGTGQSIVLAELHLAVAPRVRGVWPVRSWWVVVRAIAEIVDVDAVLIATMPEDCKTPGYLSRLGLQQTPAGVWFQRLGERE